jgi:hypothetical protein
MRDIRTDLNERLASLASREHEAMAEYQHQRMVLDSDHHNAVDAIHRERAIVKQMLAFEEQRAGTKPNEAKRTAQLTPLADFLIARALFDGPMDKDQLRAAAEQAGYFEEGNGRTFHLTLMNITTAGKLTLGTDGRYTLPESKTASLFGAGDAKPREGEMKTLM